ncbi:MAG TPA: HEAT repeat domain-containing protein [Polyangiaceae bacterium]|nr:HEAT repeat domain-containing protein [Polyangiaceae bacterium]
MNHDVAEAIDLLADADPDVRLRAAVDLGTWDAEEAAGALVARLGVEPSHAIRETLSWAVLRMPDAAGPALREALHSDRWLARMQACHVLSKLGRVADADLIRPLIADPVDAVASRAWWAAGQTGVGALASELAGQLGRGDAELRNSLSIALDELDAVGPLVSALYSRTAAAREHAADTLGLIGGPRADPAALALREALDDPDAGVRLAALNALGQLTAPLVEAALADAAASEEHRIAGLARRLIPRAARSRAARGRAARGEAAQGRAARGEQTTTSPGTGAPASGLVAHAGGVLVKVGTGSDAVAGTRTLRALATRIAAVADALPDSGRDEVLGARLGDGTVAGALDELAAATGEPITLSAIARLPGRVVAHLTVTGGVPRAGALASHTGLDDDPLVAKVARQVADCRPTYLARGDVPAEVWDAVRAEALAGARAAGKADWLAERIAAGAQAAWATEHVLLDQVSIVEPGVTIDGLLYGRGVKITGFVRLGL